MMPRIATYLMCLWLPLGALAQSQPLPQPQGDVAAQVARRLQTVKALGGSFEQRKSLAGFARPLVSRGSFLLVQGKGVLWHTREPFEAWLRVTPESLSERRGDVLTTIDAARQPGLREMNALLLAMLTGDTSRLAERFALDARSEGARWTLQLVPRERVIVSHIRSIRLSGSAHIEEVLVQEASGDRTDIRFFAHDTQPAGDSEEAQRLEKGL